MLPFKYRTHCIKEIEFRNVFKDAQVDSNLAPLNRKYYMEIDYQVLPHNKEEAQGPPQIKTIKSDVCSMDESSCIFPSFELSKESVRFGKQFRKDFDNIDNTKVKLRLKVEPSHEGEQELPVEEFDVNFLDM